MANLPTSATACSVCGEPLGVKGACFACLLRAGLEEADQEVPREAVVVFDDFEIARREDGSLWELGRGGMGVTYRATERTLHRSVALKVIETHGSEAVRERFLREARAAAALRHSNVAGVFRFGALASGDRCYCAMELVEGETLEALVRREGPLKLGTALEIAIQVARALMAAAERGLVHRDLKPANIMLTQSESSPAKIEVKVIDFGLAKAARDVPEEMELTRGEFVGTPAFASPEQFASGTIDARTDIYALGVTLWFALTGRLPFAGRTIEEIRHNQSQQKLPLVQLQGIPRHVIDLLRSCLAVDPEERPPSARRLLEALESCRAQLTTRRRNGKLAVLIGIAVFALGIAVVMFWRNREHDFAVSGIIPEKSIAVLPFENRSRDPDNAYFAEGIQDEILTRLSKIADLKVISRTSTEHYKSAPENLPEIARQLGVAYILKGSVQKNADAVRVNVQLIKAANDSRLWVDTFDRKMTDILSVESDVAKAIADQLRAKLTGREELAVAARPTDNPEAYDNYLRGLAYTLKTGNNPANALSAQKYLREAVRLDAKFALAWALLSYTDAVGYRTLTLQPTVALREEARQAAETALTLQPNLGEAVLAKGYYHYSCLNEYDTAERYFGEARRLLPNNSRISESLAYLERRRGQWDRSEAYFNEAERLDPRNVNLLSQHALLYMLLRRGPEATRKLDQVLNITPDDMDTLALQAAIAQGEGDLSRAAVLLAPLNPSADDATVLETQVYQAILERRPAAIIPRLKEILVTPDPALGYINGELRFWLGWAQQVGGDHAAAQESWQQARSELEGFLQEQPDNVQVITDLALTNMGLGDKAAALALAERAMAALPLEKDAVSGPGPIEILARVAAQMGESDRAIAALRKLLSIPAITDTSAPFTPALLRLDPMFDPLRKDPRFEKVLVEAEEVAARQSAVGTGPKKSIAVLPFENLSEEKANEYFTQGVQDEILTRLASIRDLKVISRTSTAKYKSKPDNIKKVAEELGVSTILEGSVQKAGGKVRINVQLIDARADTHLWAKSYDRDLKDVFAVESEVAQEIADTLRVKLSPAQSAAMASAPTNDTEAYDLFLRGEYEFHQAGISVDAGGAADRADAFYQRALARDPNFVAPAVQLARSRLYRHWYTSPLAPAELEEVKAIIDRSLVLAPNSPEAHLALGLFFYWGHRQYEMALAEFKRTLELQPNNVDARAYCAWIHRRRGEWEHSLAESQRAQELDPRDASIPQNIGITYLALRLWKQAEQAELRALALDPQNTVAAVILVNVRLCETGDASSARQALTDFPEVRTSLTTTLYGRRGVSSGGEVAALTGVWVYLDVMERRFPDAFQAFEKAAGNDERGHLQLSSGRVALRVLAGEAEAAKAMGEEALPLLEAKLSESPDDTFAMTELSWVYLALGRTADALRVSKKAADLISIEKDALDGAIFQQGLAQIEARAGAPEEAIKRLRRLLSIPSGNRLSRARLKNDPVWDPIRNRPDFQELLSGPEQIGPIKVSTSGPAREDKALAGLPEKSIAVLPFENLSRDPDNAYFAEGVQDEILTRLSKIADLKVISRTSTRQYKSVPTNLPEIARQLGVAYILEGSVQKSGDAVRINVQLIKAANDSHVWADTFDRKLTDIFSVESEVARAIADQLQAKLTGKEEQVLTAKPTSNPEAYDAYLRGLAYSLKPANTTANTLGAQKYLREAVRLDPKFALAWALLSSVDSLGYRTAIIQPTAALLEEARQAAETAVSLQPKLGEAVLAQGYYHYGCLKDYDTAIRYFEQARQLLPNDSRIPESLAYVTRRRGQWDKSEFYFNEAERLDVRNANLLTQHALSYMRLRRLPEALRKLDQVLNITPDDMRTLSYKAGIAQAEGDLPRAASLLASLHPTADDTGTLETKVYQAILERRPAAMISRLKEVLEKPDPELGYLIGDLRFWLGWAQRVAGDHAGAQESWRKALIELESFLNEQPANANLLADLALTKMGLGDKAAALAFAERAIAANPIEEDAVSGPSRIEILARVAAQTGEPDRAFAALQKLLSIPAVTDTAAPFTPALVRLDPMFDPLRSDPRFERILIEAEQTVARPSLGTTAPEKSIAVLPFENLSEEKANEYFAAGVQEEILTRLAAVRDLKVISRTSTEKYKSKPDNLKKIGQELGVSAILEGSVQKDGDKVRIHVQLINAATDSHLWAETYDRKLTDIFAVESEVAKAIADRLKAKLTGAEERVIAAKPTENTEAYDAYLRGLAYSLKTANTTANALNAQKHLREAVRLDPKFALSWALLSFVNARGYRTAFLQPTVALREEARQAAETALALQPKLGEAVLANGFYHYACLRDYDTAVRYFEEARPLLPNSSRIPESLAYVTRKQGQWDRSEAYFNEAERLDPRNVSLLTQHALSYKDRRQFPEALRKLEQILNITPDDLDTIIEKAAIAQAEGDLPRAATLLASVQPQANNPNALETQIYQAILERRPAPIIARLKDILATPDPALGYTNGELRFWLGWAQQVSGDDAAARESWGQARRELESFVKDQPENHILLGDLALTHAGLGERDAAFAVAEQAMAAVPIEKDAVSGPTPLEIVARVAAQLGDADRAIPVLQKLLATAYSGALGPGAPLTPALLRLDPMFDPLRGDPRFQELCKDKQP